MVLVKLLFVQIILSGLIIGQSHLEWFRSYNGPSNRVDMAISITLDVSGNVYVTGNSTGSNLKDDIVTIKYNSSGDLEWLRRYNGADDLIDEACKILADNIGNVYVAGLSERNNTAYDVILIKYNSLGDLQWIRFYNGPQDFIDVANSLAIHPSGDIYVTGYSYRNGTFSDYITLRYSPAGALLWVQRYNGTSNEDDHSNSIVIDAMGGICITGYTTNNSTFSDFTTIKYDEAGAELWARNYNYQAVSDDMAYDIATDYQGNVFVTGSSSSEYATIKYDSYGNQQWVQRYSLPGQSIDEALSIVTDDLGNAYITGVSGHTGTGLDVATIKYAPNGAQQWVQRYNGIADEDDGGKTIAVDMLRNVYITGYSVGPEGSTNVLTIKYNTDGIQQWKEEFGGLANLSDYGASLDLDSIGNVYITGYTFQSQYNPDFLTLKYSQTIGIRRIASGIPIRFSLSQNYPNPFNPSTKIRFDIPSVGQRHAFDVHLVMYDILGREIATLVNEQLQPGTYEVTWDATNYPSGVYYYRLISGDYVGTKKMVLIK